MTSIEVFQKIREISRRTLNPQHPILLNTLAEAMSVPNDRLLVLLVELANRGLIRIRRTSPLSISLTPYGTTQADPPGGLDSRDN